MLSISPSAEASPSLTPASVVRFSELVKKIGTSPATASRKRKNAAPKKLKRIVNEHQRYAKTAKLHAVALTLTYGDSRHFSPKHISAFLDRLRRALKRRGFSLPYVWTLECASRLHYHITLWLPRDYPFTSASLAKWWSWGSTWLEACRSVKAWTRYMGKFDSTATLPKGARVYGYGGLDEAGKIAVARVGLPRWLQALLPKNHRAVRTSGQGWSDVVTGESFLSPYVWTPRGCMLPYRETITKLVPKGLVVCIGVSGHSAQ